MPGKKKKGGKGKKGGDGGLPPPPILEHNRGGAVEDLLTFRIHGKEEAVCVCEEEAETFKDKNYQQHERNYQLKKQRIDHYKALIDQAHKLQEGIDSAEKVEAERIEAIVKETLDLQQKGRSDVEALQSRIKEVDEELHLLSEEVDIWTNYKDNVRGSRSEYITEMHEDMESFEVEEDELQDELTTKLQRVKLDVDRKVLHLQTNLTKKGTELIIGNLDKDTKSEFMDNLWLSKQIEYMKKVLESLRKETDALERRNIDFINTLSEAQNKEIQAMSDLYSMSTGRGLHSGRAGESGLPSLVDVTKCTSEKGAGGQAGRYEMQLLSIHGSRPPFHAVPNTVHLPPIQKQKDAHSGLPPTTKWPISNTMLSSVLGVE